MLQPLNIAVKLQNAKKRKINVYTDNLHFHMLLTCDQTELFAELNIIYL